jgi:predicted O-methyltransferase YrrM
MLSKEMNEYIEAHTTDEIPLLYDLNRETHQKTYYPNMLSGKVQGKFLEMIVAMLKPKRILEIGTFTGYSALSMVQALPEDGTLITVDKNEEIAPFAKRYFDKSQSNGKIRFMEGDAREIIPSLDETFDLIFIDADKSQYTDYYELAFPKLRKGGFFLADNVLWGGKAVEDKNPDKETMGIRNFNDHVRDDDRVHQVLLSIRDGLLLVRKLKD